MVLRSIVVVALVTLVMPALTDLQPDASAVEWSPVVALPIFVRQHLAAVVLFGHRTGEAIDPDELGMLKSLCIGASAALDHLEAEARRREVEELQRALSTYKLADSIEHA